MKIFLDCGAHDGCSIRKFRSLYDRKQKYKIYSFEPEPDFAKYFQNIPKHTFINKAVWIEDGVIDYYRSREQLRAGGTIFKQKKSGNLDKVNPIKIETIDFSKWILENLNKDDHIILKMDIEGAEYKVLPKMIEDGTINYINKLWIEWHWPKIKYPQEEHDKLIKKISIPTEKWDALLYCSFRKHHKK
jgi:FkbM family methyltransferase